MAAAPAYFCALGLSAVGVAASLAGRTAGRSPAWRLLAGGSLVPMAASLKICWDLIFHFLKAELDRLGCPGLWR
jgi:hypothetical protein